MSNLLKSGEDVIGQAEEELRRLLGRAAEIGDYDSVLVLTDWAKRLRDLLDHGAKGQVRQPVPIPENGDRRGISPAPLPLANPRNGMKGSQRTPVKRKKRGRPKSRALLRPPDYPRFLRDGENLVKIGWSKSEKAPYEHKAPHRVLGFVVGAFQRAGRDGRRFTIEDVAPLEDREDGSEIPTYQVYLCLAWLRAEKLIVQHGRQGYSLPNPDELNRLADERFRDLPQR